MRRISSTINHTLGAVTPTAHAISDLTEMQVCRQRVGNLLEATQVTHTRASVPTLVHSVNS